MKIEDKLPTVSFEPMNRIHDEEVQLIDRLLGLLEERAENHAITESVEKLLEHMRMHFDFEEERLKQAGFPMLDIHRSDHHRIMGETRMAYMNWRNFKDREGLRDFIEEDFIEWLHLHIQAMDSVAADFLAARGAEE